ncbi:hypothetical protein M0L20_17915 [Spirosoma sp. RP8]|uniref:Lipoprotein n=1 Tax=Spirosoma liriopis TaxID=2937440 RepID=A0ABT0HQ25_9BACT|nr:hypothetical protein [Spirosoma liriopis]MCK8493748.1 hypothetical protein [Spirosoma liriopis]
MRTVHSRTRLFAYGLCLAAALYNCKTKEVESVTPFTYTFKGLDNVKLPDVTPTAPAAVSVTAASVNSSTVAAAVTSGLSSMTATGQVPASVQQAATNVSKAVSAEKAAAISAEFTPAVVSNLASTGTMPASLKTEVAAIASNPALQAYLPTFTMPQVNGKTVGGRLGAEGINAPVAVANATTDDACATAANAAYASAVARLDAAKQTQSAPINAQYTSAQTTIQADATACKGSKPATYDGYRAAALQQLNQGLSNLNGVKTILGDATFNLLTVLYYVAYSQAITGINTLQSADTSTCDVVASAKLANAQAARDADLSKINSNYNAAVTSLATARSQAIASCHNQGNGGRKGADE